MQLLEGSRPDEIHEKLPQLFGGHRLDTLRDLGGERAKPRIQLQQGNRHQAEVDRYLRRRETEADELRRQIEAANAWRLAPLKARVDALRPQGSGGHAPAAD